MPIDNEGESGLLIESFPDGALGTIFAPVKAALASFGKTAAASAKLIGNDIGTFMKMTFHWKTRSLSAQKEIMDNWKTNRTKHISDIVTNSTAALDALGPDKYAVMMMCPSLFWTAKAYRGTTGLLSEDTRALLGEFGADGLPIIGGLFDGQRNPHGTGLFDSLYRSDAPPGSPEAQQEMSQALQTYLQNSGVPRNLLVPDPGLEKQSAIKNILYKINDIFLFNILDHNEVVGQVIQEGEEKESMSVTEMGEKALEEIVARAYRISFKEQRQNYLDEHRKVFEGVISAVEQILELNITLATTDNPDEFFKRLKTAVSKNQELKEIDADKLVAEFDKMTQKLLDDPEVISKLRTELLQQKLIEVLPEDQDPHEINKKEQKIFESNIKKIALDNCKGSFLQTFKEGVTDMYDSTMFAIRDGLQESTMKEIEQHAKDDELAIGFLDQIQEFQGRLDTSISKLG